MDDSLESSPNDNHHRSKKRKKDRKSHKKRRREESKEKKRKAYRSSSSSSGDDSSSSSSRHKRRRHKKKKKSSKSHKKKDKEDPLSRNYQLAEALYDLLEHHPALAEDLPIMLIRLVGGATMNLNSMTSRSAASGLHAIFSTLTPYGVLIDDDGAWKWKNPAPTARVVDERILVRIVRSLLNDIGITMEAVGGYETSSSSKQPPIAAVPEPDQTAPETTPDAANTNAEALVTALLHTFGKAELAAELVGLCDVILSGEAVSLDGLPDEKLKMALETFFLDLRLEKTEMEADEDDEDDEEVAFGYCLPASQSERRTLVESVQSICRQQSSKLRRGPLPRPINYNPSDDEDDDGPLLPGQVRTKVEKGSAAAEMDPSQAMGEGGREEWMLVPGKYDFLGAIKSQPLKNRQFSSKKSAANLLEEPAVDPKIQAEIDALRQAHEESRGPSLMEEHHKMKKAAASSESQQSRKWDRDRDLDSGRRVDKEALKLVLGGAGTDLKNKFQSSY